MIEGDAVGFLVGEFVVGDFVGEAVVVTTGDGVVGVTTKLNVGDDTGASTHGGIHSVS